MIKRQKVTAILAAVLFIIGAGAIEGEWWLLTPICFIGMAICVIIGGLDSRKTSCDAVLREHGIK